MTIIADQAQASKATSGQLDVTLLATVRHALILTSADEHTVDAAARTIAAGQVYQSATSAVRAERNQGLTDFFQVLDLLVDRIASGQPLTAARKAAEALNAPTPVQPGHHPWCVSDKCRPHHYEDDVVLTEHRGPRYDATITDGDDSIHLWAELGSDENLVDDHATVFMASNKDDGLMFDGPSLDTAIASLGEFLDGLRHLRQVMGQGRAE